MTIGALRIAAVTCLVAGCGSGEPRPENRGEPRAGAPVSAGAPELARLRNELSTGAREDCPRTTGRTARSLRATDINPSTVLAGDGPVYPVFYVSGGYRPEGPERSAVVRWKQEQPEQGRYALKVIWQIRPSFAGPVTIDVARVDGEGFAGIGEAVAGAGRLRIPARAADEMNGRWWGPGNYVWVDGPGCYAFAIVAGADRDTVVFEVAPPA